MELKPTQQDFAARADYIEAQKAEARAQAALEESRRIQEQEAILREERLQRYTNLIAQLEEFAGNTVESKPTANSTLYTDTTEWMPIASDDDTDTLSAECRFVATDTLTTQLNQQHESISTRRYNRYIEIRWRDDSIGYVGAPENLLLIEDDQLSFFELGGRLVARHRALLTDIPVQQREIDDAIDTILEPLSTRLKATDITIAAVDPLPLAEA